MPTKQIDRVIAAPFVMPAFRGNFEQWVKDIVYELEIRLKAYGTAINQGVTESEDVRYLSFVSGAARSASGFDSDVVKQLVSMLQQTPRQDDEAIRRHAMGL